MSRIFLLKNSKLIDKPKMLPTKLRALLSQNDTELLNCSPFKPYLKERDSLNRLLDCMSSPSRKYQNLLNIRESARKLTLSSPSKCLSPTLGSYLSNYKVSANKISSPKFTNVSSISNKSTLPVLNAHKNSHVFFIVKSM